MSALIHVRIAALSLDSSSNQPVILLRPVDEPEGLGRILPIWIGHPEATAILLALQSVDTPRPMTHDLLKNIVDSMDYTISRIEITRLEEGTFFAALILRGEDRTIAIDARPSDSIALAVRSGAPIFVAEDVLDEAAVPEQETIDEEATIEEFRDFIDHVDPSDFQG
ncbi:MAG: bifunctional nuclease family protein [Coriobacteriia bacterium]